MRYLVRILVWAVVCLPSIVSADESFIEESMHDFSIVENESDESNLWATCSASYDLYAEVINDEKPRAARVIKDLANGSQLAIIMAQVSSLFDQDADNIQDKFNSTWDMAKQLSTSLPEIRTNFLLASLETAVSEGKEEEWLGKLGKTVIICQNNTGRQQYYIELWRDLMKSGMLKAGEQSKPN